jgi:hypothetical protein
MPESNTLTLELNCVLLLDYKLEILKYSITDTRLVGLRYLRSRKVGFMSFARNQFLFIFSHDACYYLFFTRDLI